MRPLMFIFLLTLLGCSQSHDLPKGVSMRVFESGDVVVRLDDNRAIMVKQNITNGRTALIGNIDGSLHITQLESGGDTPYGLNFIASNKAQYFIQKTISGTNLFVFDNDGDGVPEGKIEGSKRYRLKTIEWEEIVAENK